ncbi:hypothetical protein LJC20_00955 [Eubacteriales bacterium OttesenSCG-928-M02]|nr:hypothetical protein [Eubacteriales bacterium OttesenSCG-928-M02]
MMGRGGAGYTMKDGDTMRVILQCYQKEEDAKTVQDRLKEEGLDTSIFSFLKAATAGRIDGGKAEKEAVEKALEEIAVAMAGAAEASNVVQEDGAKAKEQLQGAIDHLKAAKATLEGAYTTMEDGTLEGRIYTYLCDAIKTGEEAAAGEGEGLVTKVRYFQIFLLDEYSGLLGSLS